MKWEGIEEDEREVIVLTLQCEYLHPVVVLVRHHEPPHTVHTHRGRSVELACQGD